MPKYVGIDVHLQTCHATVMDGRGRIKHQERFPNEPEEFTRVLKGIGDTKIAMEASYCRQPAYELLEGMGYEVKLVHPMKTRVIAEAKIKTRRLGLRGTGPFAPNRPATDLMRSFERDQGVARFY